MTLISPALAALVQKGLTALPTAKVMRLAVGGVAVLAFLVAEGGRTAHQDIRAKKPPDANPTVESDPPKQAASEQRPRNDAYGDLLPPGAISRLGCMRLRHGGGVLRIAFSPDGKLLASAGSDGLIRLWDVRTGKEVRQLRGHNAGTFYGPIFSSDGKLLASCGQLEKRDRTIAGVQVVLVWDVETGKRRSLFEHAGQRSGVQQATSVAFSPDGKVLASGGTGGSIYLWDVQTRNVLQYFQCPNGTDTVAFSRDGATLFSASQFDDVIRRWDVSTAKELPALTGQKIPWNATLALNIDGKTLAVPGADGICRVWDLSSSKIRFQIGDGKKHISFPIFSPDGKTIAGTEGGRIRFWEMATGKELRQITTTTGAFGLTFSPDGSSLAWFEGSAIYVADSRKGTSRFEHPGHKGGVGRVTFSSDGSKVVTSGADKTIRVWETRTGRELHRRDGDVAAFSPDGKLAASMAETVKGVRLWDPVSGKDLRYLRGGDEFTRNISANCTFSADGKYVAAWGGMNEPIRIWETTTGKQRRSIPINWLLGRLALSPGGQQVAAAKSGGLNEPIFIWDLDSGREIKVLSGRMSATNALAFSLDSLMLAVAASSPGVRFLDVRTGEDRGQIAVPLVYVGTLVFSPDGKNLATVGGFDGSAYIWETATGKMRLRLEGQVGRVRTVAFSPDGRLLVTGGDDGTPLVWDVMDVAPSRSGRQVKPSAEMLTDCWAALCSEDAQPAWQVMRRLVAEPEQTVSFLRERLAAQAVAAERAEQWIAELDADSFAVRERASRELSTLGKHAIPPLRRALENSPSAELTRRAKDLLAKLDKPGLSSAELAGLRAIEVLEHIGTSDARQLLGKLAKEGAETRLKQEAMTSLQRLEKRPNKP